MQMLHQHAMLKRLQELQRHQQLQEFGDGRQQNYLNQLSAMNKQASGGQFQPPINGTPIHNASQMFMVGNMNMVQRGASPAVQGFPNGLYFQAQSQDMRSMDVSLFQTPISSAINNLHQHSHVQGLSHDSENGLKGSVNQAEKPIMKSSGFSNSFLGGTCTVSLDQLCNPDEALMSKQVFDGKNLLGHTTHQGFNSGILPENFQQVNTLQRNASAQQFSGRQDQAGWPGLFPEKTAQLDPSQGPTTLDPLEQKILFNMHDNSWNDSFERNSSIGTGGCDEVLERTGYASSFPSIQSGSWSALMQSAVAEASSSDNVLQEEWSGLTFQNTELSTDNQPSTFVDRGKHQTSWVDNNVRSASSPGSKAQLLFNDSNRSSSFPVFQLSDSQFSVKHREGMHCDSSPESVQQSPKIAVKWLDCNTRQNQSIEESQLLHTMSPMENARRGQSLEHIEGYAHQHSISSYKNSHQPCNQLIGSQIESPSPSDSFRLNVLQHTITEHEAGENMWLHGKDKSVAGGYQKSSGQGHLSEIQNSKASEELRPRASIGANTSASFDLTSQTREQGTVAHFSPADSNPLLVVPEAEIAEASMVKPFDRSFTSQRTDLRLAPPTQRPNSNSFFPSQSSPKMDNSTAASPTGPFYLQNQLQKHHLPAAPVATQSPEATLSDMARRLPHFNCDTSQGNSRPNLFNPSGLFPMLEDVPVGQPSLMSGLPKQVGSSTRSPHLWTNVSTQSHLSGIEALKVPSDFLVSADSMNKSVQTTSWATQELHDQNSYRVTPSHDWGACPMMSQGFESGEEHPGKDRSHQQITPEILDQGLDTDGLAHEKDSVPRCLSETNAIDSGSWMTHPLHQDFDRARHGGSQSPAVSARDLEAFGRSLEPSNLQQTYSLLHLVHSVKNVVTDPSKMVSENNNLGTGPDLNVQKLATAAEHQMMCGNNSGVRDPVNNRLNVASRINSFPTTDFKMLSFSSEVGEDQSTKASSLPLPQESPQEMVTPCQSYSQGHPSYDNVAVNRTQQSQISLQMASSWFKHYGTLRNGEVLPMYDVRTAKNSVQQFFPGKTFENLHMTTSVGQVSAAGVTDQNLTVLRPKKRKIVSCEFLPWHKEVTQSSKSFENISTAELEWAQATNRLTEKVEAQTEIIDYMLPLLQPKKRIVLTTQLMQQLFRPAPASILSADASSNYDTVANFTAKLALGDACSLTTCSISDSCPSSGYGMMSENHRTSKKIGDHCFSRTVEDFMKRAKKLESDFLRLDKAASVVDIRVECQDLEKFSVVNRFAKFYCRGQPDAADTSSASGTTPTSLKSLPQRYVTAFPMPKAVPKVEQCFSL